MSANPATGKTPRPDPQCLAGSFEQPGCAAERFKATITDLERRLRAALKENEQLNRDLAYATSKMHEEIEADRAMTRALALAENEPAAAQAEFGIQPNEGTRPSSAGSARAAALERQAPPMSDHVNLDYSDAYPPAPEPAGGMPELLRLLYQRYQDLGDTLARKAAWEIEELQARVRELREASKLKDDLIALNFNRAEQAEARPREAEKDAERYQAIRDAGSQLKLWIDDDWYYKPRPELVDQWCDAALAARGEKEEKQ